MFSINESKKLRRSFTRFRIKAAVRQIKWEADIFLFTELDHFSTENSLKRILENFNQYERAIIMGFVADLKHF